MNKRRRYRSVLLLGTGCLRIVGACGLWLRAVRRQEALNRQLIAALVKKAPNQALVLVNAGTDPNTPLKSLPPPYLIQLWNHLIHRTPPPSNPSPSAFLLVCGASTCDDYRFPCLTTDEPQLAEAMLEHGAHKNAEDGSRETPIMCRPYRVLKKGKTRKHNYIAASVHPKPKGSLHRQQVRRC